MAKIETVTALLVDEINHFEQLLKNLKKEKEDLQNIKIKPELKDLHIYLEAHLKIIKSGSSNQKKILDASIIELKKQNKKFLFYLILLSLFMVTIMIEFFLIKK